MQKINAVGISKEELLEAIAYSEGYSNHPIAESVKSAFKKDIDKSKIESIEEISGLGILAKIQGRDILVGNEKLLNKNNIEFTKCEDIGTVLYTAINGIYSGYILIADRLKEDSKETIIRLKKSGIIQTVMLTGDRIEVRRRCGKEVKYR